MIQVSVGFKPDRLRSSHSLNIRNYLQFALQIPEYFPVMRGGGEKKHRDKNGSRLVGIGAGILQMSVAKGIFTCHGRPARTSTASINVAVCCLSTLMTKDVASEIRTLHTGDKTSLTIVDKNVEMCRRPWNYSRWRK